MSNARLVQATELAERIQEGGVIVIDCRFDLMHRSQGLHHWMASHIPGARYAHLDDDLAGRVRPGTGRHPLPHPRSFAAFLARTGWTPGQDIVAYDANGGAFAARLWWLMRYFGHDCVALLDGGIGAWRRAQLPLESGLVRVEKTPLPKLRANPAMVVDAASVQRGLQDGSLVLLDARSVDRYRGENETIDPVAGHVPGALSLPFAGNLDEQGCFLPPERLAARFQPVLKQYALAGVAHMCGSGVTACHNQFAMERAGLASSQLYAGSWSEWITDDERPVAVGPG